MTGRPTTRRQLFALGALVAALTGISLGVHFADWFGSWGETSRALEDSTVLSYPVVAGVAAWFASGAKRRRYLWLIESAERSRYSILMIAAGIQTAAASVGFLLVSLVASAGTATQANFGRPVILDALTIVGGFAAMAGLGAVAGTFLPTMVSPIAAVVIVYGVEVLADTGKPSLRSLAGLTVSDPRERTYRSTLIWMFGLRGVWLLALALFFLALAARARTRWQIPFAVACLTATPLLLVGDTGMQVSQAALLPVCHKPTPAVTICLTAARDHTYPKVWSTLKPEIARLSGLTEYWRVNEEGIGSVPGATDDGVQVTVPVGIANGVNGNSHVVDSKRLQADFSTQLVRSNCKAPPVSSDGNKPIATPQDVIQAWLLDSLGVSIDSTSGFEFPQLSDESLDYASVAAFRKDWASMTKEERTAWFQANGQMLVDCRLSASDVSRR